MSIWWCEHLWPGEGDVRDGVLVESDDGIFTKVEAGTATAPEGAQRLFGLTIPGFANTHSHAFHRALRARTQSGRGTFWTWREQMYAVAERLEPERYFALARATFGEMVLAGITSVGEFHYLHHQRDGARYDDANEMGLALVSAAAAAGLRITVLDTCYLESAPGQPLQGPQRRFGDTTAQQWAARVDDLARTCADSPGVVVGAAVHSVRAVPPPSISTVAKWARGADAPLHAHLSEQVAENDACLAAYGTTPTGVLDEEGALGPGTTVVHATHLTAGDVRALGSSGTGACFCPTTERDLADGIGRAADQSFAGSPLSLGTDSHAVIDMFEEARALELDERLRTQARGHFRAAALLAMATRNGHRALGWAAGRIEAGQRADLVTVRLTSPRTSGAGATAETAVFAASAADIEQVVVDGTVVVREGQHVRIPDVGADLDAAIRAVLS